MEWMYNIRSINCRAYKIHGAVNDCKITIVGNRSHQRVRSDQWEAWSQGHAVGPAAQALAAFARAAIRYSSESRCLVFGGILTCEIEVEV
jgi:hypothetical protein